MTREEFLRTQGQKIVAEMIVKAGQKENREKFLEQFAENGCAVYLGSADHPQKLYSIRMRIQVELAEY